MPSDKVGISSEPKEAVEVRQKGGLVLIEWREGPKLRRAWIKSSQIVKRDGKRLFVIRPEGGVPFGVEWARLIGNISISPNDLETELRRLGIWTTEDLRNNPGAALSAIQSACGLTLASLINAAKQYDKDASV